MVPPDPWRVRTITTYPLAPSLRGDGTLTRGAGPRTEEQQELFDQVEARRKEGIDRAAQAYADALATCALMTPREQAEAAYHPGGPSVEELEDEIRADRGLPPIHR